MGETRFARDTESAVFGDWVGWTKDLAESFAAANPFPHVVIDGFLAVELAAGLLEEFPDVDRMPRSRDYMFGRKKELSSVAEAGPACARFAAAVSSPEFQTHLSTIVGRDLFIDKRFHGGGFHQGSDGSFLDFHVDFNIHPLHPDWLRVANILLYLNTNWKPAYGGDLLIRSAAEQRPTAIAPLYNRAVIMLTDDHTYHGYQRMNLPDGITRKSIATYAYALTPIGSILQHTTRWVPGSGSVVKMAVASQYDRAVRWKNRILGSGTARNR